MAISRLLTHLLIAATCLAAAGCATKPSGGYVAPARGEVIAGYGEGKNGFHHGIDIASAPKAPVKAVMDGTVIFRGRTKSFGRMVVVDHGAGLRSYYGNLGAFAARKGEVVRRGEKIGRVGRTRAGGGQMHFELRLKKVSVDPADILPLDNAAPVQKVPARS